MTIAFESNDADSTLVAWSEKVNVSGVVSAVLGGGIGVEFVPPPLPPQAKINNNPKQKKMESCRLKKSDEIIIVSPTITLKCFKKLNITLFEKVIWKLSQKNDILLFYMVVNIQKKKNRYEPNSK